MNIDPKLLEIADSVSALFEDNGLKVGEVKTVIEIFAQALLDMGALSVPEYEAEVLPIRHNIM